MVATRGEDAWGVGEGSKKGQVQDEGDWTLRGEQIMEVTMLYYKVVRVKCI